MVNDEFLREYLPKTRVYSPEQLWAFTETYQHVMLKPSGGGGGAGIIQVSAKGENKFLVHSGKRRRVVAGKAATIGYVQSLFRPKTYLIQPRIPLGKINGKPFDVRVMLQRRGQKEPWKMTGWCAKLAGSGYVVTNVARSRGQVLPIRTAISQSNIQAGPDILIDIRFVAKSAAERLGKAYPTLREIGFDVGIDVDGKPWIIEANFRPSLSLFQKLPDPSFYRRIIAMRNR